VWTAYETREHDKISTKPSPTFTWDTNPSSEGDQGIVFQNVGLGPAIVTTFQALLDDKPMSLDDLISSFYQENESSKQKVKYRSIQPTSTAPIGAGKEIPLVVLVTNDPDLREKVQQFLWRIKLRVTNCSFYNECSDVFFPSRDVWRRDLGT
jgi:hypothetical protein